MARIILAQQNTLDGRKVKELINATWYDIGIYTVNATSYRKVAVLPAQNLLQKGKAYGSGIRKKALLEGVEGVSAQIPLFAYEVVPDALPAPKEGIYYVVPKNYAETYCHRQDLAIADELVKVKDANGKVMTIGCQQIVFTGDFSENKEVAQPVIVDSDEMGVAIDEDASVLAKFDSLISKAG
jgi:hypothetical protein